MTHRSIIRIVLITLVALLVSVSGWRGSRAQQSTRLVDIDFKGITWTQSTTTGKWHGFQAHLDIPNRLAELWVDGQLVLRHKNMVFDATEFGWAQIGSNNDTAIQPTDEPTDFTGISVDTAEMPPSRCSASASSSPPSRRS